MIISSKRSVWNK